MLSPVYTYSFKTPYGELILGEWEKHLVLCDWRYRKMRAAVDSRLCNNLQAVYREVNEEELQKHPTLIRTISQLNQYFNSERESFDLPIYFAGSEFQKSVWRELLKIPYGKTTTYLELSRRLHNQKAIRAVAAANGANAMSIITPCHRVLGSGGELTGYAGGIQVKKRLLQLEAKKKLPVQTNLFE